MSVAWEWVEGLEAEVRTLVDYSVAMHSFLACKYIAFLHAWKDTDFVIY